MKFGFMPKKLITLPTNSFSTAPAASSTATMIRSWMENPLVSSVLTTLFSDMGILPFSALMGLFKIDLLVPAATPVA